MKWLLKAAIHRVLGTIPGGHRVNEVLQVHVTKSLELTQSRFENKLSDCATHWRHYQEFSLTGQTPRRAVELGSGWYPVTPLGLALHGVPEILTCDIAPLLKPERVRLAMQRIVQYHRNGQLAAWWPQANPERIKDLARVAADERMKTVDDLLGPLGIRVLVCDARDMPLETGSVDLVTSYGVLMHIAPAILESVLKEFRRVASPSAVLSHWIDLCDLYYWSDSSISPLNFLKFSDATWRMLQDPIAPMNRLRLSDYRALLAEAGFDLLEEQNRAGQPRDLDRVRIADRFAKYDRDELLVLDTWLAARPQMHSPPTAQLCAAGADMSHDQN